MTLPPPPSPCQFAYTEGDALTHLSGIADRLTRPPAGVLGPYDKARFVNLERYIPLAGTGEGVDTDDAADAAASAKLSARGGWEALRSGGAAVLGRGRALVEGRGTYYATRSSDLASFLALMCCVLSAAVALVLSLSMYSHLSFWMPSLESQLWYVGVSSKTRAAATIFNTVAIVCCVLGLGYQCAVTGTVAHPRLLFHRERCEERLGAHSRQRVGPPPLPSLGWRAARLVVREADPRARLQRLSRCGARDAPLGEEGRGRRDRAHGC